TSSSVITRSDVSAKPVTNPDPWIMARPTTAPVTRDSIGRRVRIARTKTTSVGMTELKPGSMRYSARRRSPPGARLALAIRELFFYRAVGGVDGAVDVGVGRGVRVGDRDAPQLRAPGDVWALVASPVGRIREVVILVRVTVRPAVHGYRRYIAFRVEAPSGKRAIQLPQYPPLEILEAHLEQPAPSGHVLFARGKAAVRDCGHEAAVDDRRLLRIRRVPVVAHADRKIEAEGMHQVRFGYVDAVVPELVECLPVP